MEEMVMQEFGVSLVVTVLGAVWTFFKSSEWYEKLRKRKYFKAMEALEAAVEETYRTYVREIKNSRMDGQLTDDERKQARELARNRAMELAHTDGVEVIRELGDNYMDLWIQKIVKKLKGF